MPDQDFLNGPLTGPLQDLANGFWAGVSDLLTPVLGDHWWNGPVGSAAGSAMAGSTVPIGLFGAFGS